MVCLSPATQPLPPPVLPVSVTATDPASLLTSAQRKRNERREEGWEGGGGAGRRLGGRRTEDAGQTIGSSQDDGFTSRPTATKINNTQKINELDGGHTHTHTHTHTTTNNDTQTDVVINYLCSSVCVKSAATLSVCSCE